MQISFVSFENENSQGNENVILGGQREHVVLWYYGTLVLWYSGTLVLCSGSMWGVRGRTKSVMAVATRGSVNLDFSQFSIGLSINFYCFFFLLQCVKF